ncbi:hypothetical protein LC612_38840 [Nostoc sp. CHAB 5834]|nr:hypothetical protein [Nostoc sp. CHAB 5834]
MIENKGVQAAESLFYLYEEFLGLTPAKLQAGLNVETDMRDSYLAYVEEDERLLKVVEPILPHLKTLPKEQVETLVFYLKSLQSYSSSSANELQNRLAFEEKLDAIRSSYAQTELLSKARWKLLLGIFLCLAAAVVAVPGVLELLAGRGATAATWVLPAGGLLLSAHFLLILPAIELFKQQDRRYFLESIRAARSCNELDWAGLFAYNGATMPGAQSEKALDQAAHRTAELTAQLRTALYNDEYLSYSKLDAGG